MTGGGRTMLLDRLELFRRPLVGVAIGVALLAWAPSSQARITRIILDPPTALTGQDIPYERIAGRAWGELDPSDPKNALITDIGLAPKKANGNVEYIASFFIVKPVDMSQASGVMWHDVPNRGGRITITADLRQSARRRVEQRLARRQCRGDGCSRQRRGYSRHSAVRNQ